MKFIKKLFGTLFLLFVIVSAVIISGGYGKYKQAITLLPLSDAAAKIYNNESFTKIEDISKTFVNASVAVEDRRFYKHKGIDLLGIARAVKTNIQTRSLSEGGSCITQQLAKNIYFMNDRSLSRKVAEMLLALSFEKEFSKDEILELYFNVIYYGSGYYNITDASRGYFGKEPSRLSDYEATLLAGIPNAPSVYSPKKNPALAAKRQKKVLEAMVDCGYFTKEQAAEILEEK